MEHNFPVAEEARVLFSTGLNLRQALVAVLNKLILFCFGDYEYPADFVWVNELPGSKDYQKEDIITVGAEYFLSKNFN